MHRTHKSLSDYEIAYNLGLTEKRVRSLREKIEFQFGQYDENYLKDVFISQLKNAVFDAHDGMIKILISEVSLMTKIRYKLDKLGLYDEVQLNNKVLQCKPDVFIALLSSLYDKNSNFSKKYLINFFEKILKSEKNDERARCFLEKIIKDLEGYDDNIPSYKLFNCIKVNLPAVTNAVSFGASIAAIISFFIK